MPSRWFVLWLSAVAVFLPSSAAACSPTLLSTDALVANTAAVFRGRVLSIDIADRFDLQVPSGMWIVHFEVITAWKGPAETEIMVMTDPPSGGCPVGFKKGREYLVFATQSSPDHPLLTSGGYRTEEFRPNSSDVKYLEANVPPLPLKPRSAKTSSCAATGAELSWAALLLLAGMYRRGARARGRSR